MTEDEWALELERRVADFTGDLERLRESRQLDNHPELEDMEARAEFKLADTLHAQATGMTREEYVADHPWRKIGDGCEYCRRAGIPARQAK